MEEGGDVWFWHVLALALGRTIGELQQVMTHREFESWKRFYASRPFDDAHRYHRPAALVAGSLAGGGAKAMRERLDWLRNEVKPVSPPPAVAGGWSKADLETMKALMAG